MFSVTHHYLTNDMSYSLKVLELKSMKWLFKIFYNQFIILKLQTI